MNNSTAGSVARWNRHQLYQHLLMAGSMIMLIITGFPIKYHQWGWAQTVINLFGSFGTMFSIHLISGVIMLVSGAYHLAWMFARLLKGKLGTAMVPTLKDVKDAWHHGKFLLGLTKEPPPYDRYTYLEKFEYLAVYWGVIVMGGTGLILWFPGLFGFMPRTALHIVRVAHTNEAFVAMLAVVVGHFFAVHFNPHVFPSSKVWINGTIAIPHLKEEHPLEYQKMLQENDELEKHSHHHSRFSHSLTLVSIELAIYVIVFIALLATFIPLLFA